MLAVMALRCKPRKPCFSGPEVRRQAAASSRLGSADSGALVSPPSPLSSRRHRLGAVADPCAQARALFGAPTDPSGTRCGSPTSSTSPKSCGGGVGICASCARSTRGAAFARRREPVYPYGLLYPKPQLLSQFLGFGSVLTCGDAGFEDPAACCAWTHHCREKWPARQNLASQLARQRFFESARGRARRSAGPPGLGQRLLIQSMIG
jgi:hypothetical protein